MASIFNNDEAYTFFATNGYPTDYNDGMTAYLRDYFHMPDAALPDLFCKYIHEIGDIFDDVEATELIVEGGDGMIAFGGDNIVV